MAPTIHLVRHAQGEHNVSVAAQSIRDPTLTDLGRSQCEALRNAFPLHSNVTNIVASPMRRTLYTALLSFAPVVEAGVRVTALPSIQEVSSLHCDVGSELSKLKAEFDDDKVDFSALPEDWYNKGPQSPYAPETNKLVARAAAARRWLRDLTAGKGDDDHVVVVTHGGFLHFLTEDWHGVNLGRGTGWENTELRSYVFADPEGKDERASLKETAASWRKRRGSATGLTETEQMELRAVVTGYLEHEFDVIEKSGTGVQFDAPSAVESS